MYQFQVYLGIIHTYYAKKTYINKNMKNSFSVAVCLRLTLLIFLIRDSVNSLNSVLQNAFVIWFLYGNTSLYNSKRNF